MIISHKHNFVFISTPKTGTHSMYKFLKENYAPVELNNTKNFHEWVVPHKAKNYFAFSTVRNPYERLVALWYSILIAGKEEKGKIPKEYRMSYMRHLGDDSFETFAKFCAEKRETVEQHTMLRLPMLLIPQWRWYEEFLPKDTAHLKLENLEEDFASLPFAVEKPTMPHELKRNHASWDDLKTPELTELVNHWAEKDFSKFGYQKETP